ncbi:MAG: SUMF1/EgtB/PvdO family nonheme iron enzyme [Candidatus Cloacimonetes bacterium]|jgi:formylglycine-generating enzyme required for sulfatase activity|nr:SUMF1/EgtB/PvdO family nonheme iron enzyme [Candidatus Cloacimonadota bacterium]MDD3143038.1 SUMF1/EgtB/PvdO family nonheme iron enzyme [Candidatus Cloacimonadota bacterium]MDY0368005.1 SUMF1/EgtB/PvdO family nonheme iron enzyme [Candidatus Syntrophosphaera sp.]
MRYCGNCGQKIPEKSKFCVHCGARREDLEASNNEQNHVPQPEAPEVIRSFGGDRVTDAVFKLMDPGDAFCGYTIVRMLNKDPEGIKYIAEKDGKKYVLKLFFKYKYSDLESIMGLQKRLKRMGNLSSVHTARVAEINQTHDPVFMATEFVSGDSLARIKANNAGRLSEDFVREVAKQLVQTAIAVRQQGLSLHELTPSGIMVPEDSDNITVLSSGIKYEEVDEREEVFNLGVIIAQLLSGNVLYNAIYNSEHLKQHKFANIPGVTLSMNRILSDCLHRNILQRYTSLETLLKGLNGLPPVDQDEVFAPQGAPQSLEELQDQPMPPPKRHLEWTFWLLIGLIAAGLALFFIFGLPAILKPGGLVENIGNIITGTPDTLETNTQNVPQPRQPGNAPAGQQTQNAVREDPRKLSLPGEQTYQNPGTKPAKTAAPPDGSRFVRVPGGIFGFGRLKDNPNSNTSQDGFWIGKYEVTQSEWDEFMTPPYLHGTPAGNLPVENVSWIDIIRYCNARSENEGLQPAYRITGGAASVSCDFSANGYRLPTEAEWEMAAKAGTLLDYSGSDDPNDVAWHYDNSKLRYRAGGGKRANAYGIYDMSGNVAEWCWDWYDAKYPSKMAEFNNPRGPSGGSLKVIRGGSVKNGIGTKLGILNRESGNPNLGYSYVGFRLVRSR